MPQAPHSATFDLACELLRRPSVSPADGGCLDLLATRLGALGFVCERLDAGDTLNLWARLGQQAPLVCLAGHVDVVPAGDVAAWRSPPFTPTLDAGKLYGRGAADMKSSVAAFVTAVESLLQEHGGLPHGSIALLLTSDEEGPATHGTTHVIETLRARGEEIDFCIVGEPTCSEQFGDTIKNGRRGSLNGQLIVHGIQGHIAYPDLADNPIHRALPALAELARERWDEGDADFPPTSWQLSNLNSGTGAGNVIPAQCEALFNFRFAACTSAQALQERVEAILQKHQLRYSLNWQLSGEPFITRRGRLTEALQNAIATHCDGVQAGLSTSGGTSDGRFIATWCDEVAEFGPLNASIHQVDEHIDIACLPTLAAIYRDSIAQLLCPNE